MPQLNCGSSSIHGLNTTLYHKDGLTHYYLIWNIKAATLLCVYFPQTARYSRIFPWIKILTLQQLVRTIISLVSINMSTDKGKGRRNTVRLLRSQVE
jgi:hypothetical protein